MVTQEQRDKTYADLCKALAEWRKMLQEDLGTHYEHDPNWRPEEDEVFLIDTIQKVKRFQEEIAADQNTLPPE